MRRRPGGPGQVSLCIRGAVGLLALVVGSVLLVGFGTGAIVTDPVVRSTLPVEAGAVKANSTVSFKGATVGTVSRFDPGIEESGMEISLDPDHMRNIPAGVRVRVVPRTHSGSVRASGASSGAVPVSSFAMTAVTSKVPSKVT